MSTERIQCSQCGQVMHVVVDRQPPAMAGWEQVERRQVSMGATGPVPNATEYWRETPTRPAAVGADVGVPFLQSLITAVIIGLLLILPADRLQLPAWSVLVGAGVAFFVSWVLLTAFYRGLLLQRETVVAEPPVQPEPPVLKSVRLQVDEKNRRLIGDLPIDADRLTAVARAVLNGRPFSVASLTGKGQPLSRSEFVKLRTWLISNQYAAWVNPNNRQAGVKFTRRGEALLRGLAQ